MQTCPMKPLIILLMLTATALAVLPEPTSKARATLRRIKVETVNGVEGRGTSISVEIDVPKQKMVLSGNG